MAETNENVKEDVKEQPTNVQYVVPGEWAQKTIKVAKGVGLAGAAAGLFGLGWYAKSRMSYDDEIDETESESE